LRSDAAIICTFDGSLCGRKICRHGKTQLWVTVYEKLGGKACSKLRKSCGGCCEEETPEPPKKSRTY
ncbi:MAG: hypothetical protein HY293_04975, partial [Planctomycetes bacterium]|nr:hypothetical protein [Planctomycetota bacterium]